MIATHTSRRWWLLPLMLLGLFSLGGCVGAAIHVGERAADEATIATNGDAAHAGDPAAEYRLGDAYCCAAFGNGGLFKDNDKATFWLCRAARKGYAPAQLRLARIYAGDRAGGLALKERLVGAAVGVRTNKPVALGWADVAAASTTDAGTAATARALAAQLRRQQQTATSEKRRAFGNLAPPRNPATLPCRWNEVFPKG